VAAFLLASGAARGAGGLVVCKIEQAIGSGGGCGGGPTSQASTGKGGADGSGLVFGALQPASSASGDQGAGPSREDEARGAREDRRNSERPRYTPPAAPPSDTGGQAPGTGGLGAPVPGTSAPTPAPPPWQAPDAGAGPHAVESPGITDRAVEFAAETAANAMALSWPHASRNLLHYLDNSGTPLPQDVDAMLHDVPQFQADVNTLRSSLGATAVQRAQAMGATGPVTFPVSTPWQGFYISPEMSKDWFYALGGVSYNLVGTVTVYPPTTPGGPWRYELRSRVELRDRYNWDVGKATQIGPFTVTDQQLAELHRKGLAQEFDVTGSSTTTTTKGEVP
jgi:hypothetical protein